MALYISSECIACGRCFKDCPVNCIFAGDGQYEIDNNKCVECGTCTSVCPINAIKESE